MSTARDDVRVAHRLLDWRLDDMTRLTRPSASLEVTHAVTERRGSSLGAEPERDRPRCSRRCRADHEDLARSHARDAAEQEAAAALRPLEVVAPACAASRPATSLIGASSGRRRSSVSTVS